MILDDYIEYWLVKVRKFSRWVDFRPNIFMFCALLTNWIKKSNSFSSNYLNKLSICKSWIRSLNKTNKNFHSWISFSQFRWFAITFICKICNLRRVNPNLLGLRQVALLLGYLMLLNLSVSHSKALKQSFKGRNS